MTTEYFFTLFIEKPCNLLTTEKSRFQLYRKTLVSFVNLKRRLFETTAQVAKNLSLLSTNPRNRTE